MASVTQNLPVKSFRLNNVSVSIFENEVERDGRIRRFSNVKLEKRYRDKQGNWKSANSFSLDELLRLRLLLDKTVGLLADKIEKSDGDS